MSKPAAKPQWFIAADGTVIQSWPPGLDNDRMKYLRYPTNRRLQLSDLYALDERLDRFRASSDRLSRVLLFVGVAAVSGVALGWLVLPWLGVGTGVTTPLLAVSIPLLIVCALGAALIPGIMRSRFDRIYTDAGLELSVPKVIKEREAQALIQAPGTVPGHQPSGEER